MPAPSRSWIVAASFLAALMLTAMPLPHWAGGWRPAWVALVLIYWSLALPNRVGMLTGWCLGLLLDVLTGAVLGENALGLAIIGFLATHYHQRLRVFPLGQQAVLVGAILWLYLTLGFAVQTALGRRPDLAANWLPILTSAPLWPWLFIILRDARRWARLT